MVGLSSGSGKAGPSAPIIEQRYHPGDRVQHPVWEAGIVMVSRLQDGDETVDVFFEGVGFKRLIASMANQTILPKQK